MVGKYLVLEYVHRLPVAAETNIYYPDSLGVAVPTKTPSSPLIPRHRSTYLPEATAA